ncbi:hypothetical protein [Ensifer aridi]|uniref:hypothetical protein n=1 Tax=Ensifer aridi TaxID=1708715 RepID=UPI00155409CE|nr:hypothetical protein [Ensifer aridi]
MAAILVSPLTGSRRSVLIERDRPKSTRWFQELEDTFPQQHCVPDAVVPSTAEIVRELVWPGGWERLKYGLGTSAARSLIFDDADMGKDAMIWAERIPSMRRKETRKISMRERNRFDSVSVSHWLS